MKRYLKLILYASSKDVCPLYVIARTAFQLSLLAQLLARTQIAAGAGRLQGRGRECRCTLLSLTVLQHRDTPGFRSDCFDWTKSNFIKKLNLFDILKQE